MVEIFNSRGIILQSPFITLKNEFHLYIFVISTCLPSSARWVKVISVPKSVSHYDRETEGWEKIYFPVCKGGGGETGFVGSGAGKFLVAIKQNVFAGGKHFGGN